MKKETNIIRIIGIVFLIISLSIVFLHKYPNTWKFSSLIKAFYANISSELFSIALTILLIDYLYERKAKLNTKNRLLRELGSEDRGFTSRALKELRQLNSLVDGSLKDLDLSNANLSNLDFTGANLENVNLENAQLNGTIFKNANLTKTNFSNAQMKEAILEHCIFDNTKLIKTNLYSARLSNSTIKSSDFLSANLQLSEMVEVKITESKLEDADLTQANLTRIIIKNCVLLRTNVNSINASNAKFERCDLNELKGYNQISYKETAEFLACTNIPQTL